jgi:poly(A) polymerase
VTDRLPAEVAARFVTADLGDARFGTVHVQHGGLAICITTLRADGTYGDHRRPDEVAFVRALAADAARRDFTVNGLYYDLATGEVIDHVGGLDDLAARRLRTIGEPARRFAEDALRLLRLIRFAARCGLDIAPATAAAARAAAAELRRLSPERAYRELSDMLTAPGRGRALGLLVEHGLAAELLPEVAAMAGVPQPPEFHPEGDVLTHTMRVLDLVPADDEVLSWAAVLHDVGKPPTFRPGPDRIRFDGHDLVSERLARDVLLRLHAPRALAGLVGDLCRDHIRFATLPEMRPRRRERWLRAPDFARHLEFHRADCLGSHGKLDVYDFAAQALAALPPLAEMLVRGGDALALGVPQGPAVGRLLAQVHAEADEAAVSWDRERALERLRQIVAAWRQGQGPDAR